MKAVYFLNQNILKYKLHDTEQRASGESILKSGIHRKEFEYVLNNKITLSFFFKDKRSCKYYSDIITRLFVRVLIKLIVCFLLEPNEFLRVISFEVYNLLKTSPLYWCIKEEIPQTKIHSAAKKISGFAVAIACYYYTKSRLMRFCYLMTTFFCYETQA